MSPTLVAYVSGHGFGHATRVRALLAAVRARAGTGLRIAVRSEAPAWIFGARNASVDCATARVDPGLLQPNGLDIDLAASLAAHEAFLADWASVVRREAGALRELGATLVVADIPAVAFAAAAAVGVPAFGVTNFGWDWILDEFASAEPRWGAPVALHREAYGLATGLFRLPFHGDLSAFPGIVDAPLLVNRATRPREASRRALGVAAGERRPLVLLSFGGLGPVAFAAGSGEDLSGFVFLGSGPAPKGLEADWIPLAQPAPIPHEDVMAACDAVIGKPGYSTVAEAIAHGTRFLHLPRDGFREAAPLVEGLRRYARSSPMPREDFAAGRWRRHLDAVFAAPTPPDTLPDDGDTFIANRLLAEI